MSLREILTGKVLSGPYTREAIDLDRFYRDGRHRAYDRLALGTYTATDLIAHHKMISTPHAPVTDYELARAYLGSIWAEQKPRGKDRVGFNSGQWHYLDVNPPAYFERAHTGELAYVDIQSCYFQLYQPLTLDLQFRAGGDPYFGLGKVHFLEAEWLRQEKRIRNGLVGIARTRTRREYAAGKFQTLPAYNKFLAPQLWAYLMFTLHAIAHEARQVVPVYYWNTDGCITGAWSAAKLIDYLRDEWSLRATIRGRPGVGTVHGFGSYELPGARTALTHGSKAINYLIEVEPELREKLKRWRKWALRSAGDRV